METQNNEKNNSLPDVKELLKTGNVDQALQGLGIETQENIAFKSDLNRVSLEMYAHQTGEKSQDFTQGLDNIFAQYLNPQNNIA